MATKQTSTEIVEVKPQPAAVTALRDRGELIREIMTENFEGETLNVFSLPRVRVAPGSMQVFSRVTMNGQETPKELTGIIVEQGTWRAKWSQRIGSGGAPQGQPPECTSMDGHVGIGDPGGDCHTCPLNQWGSAVDDKGQPSRGKLCKEIRPLFMLLDDAPMMPTLLTLPPTSAKSLTDYKMLVSGQGLTFWQCHVRITLAAAQNAGGIGYGKAVITPIAELDGDAQTLVRAYRDMIRPLVKADIVQEIMTQEADAYGDDSLAGRG